MRSNKSLGKQGGSNSLSAPPKRSFTAPQKGMLSSSEPIQSNTLSVASSSQSSDAESPRDRATLSTSSNISQNVNVNSAKSPIKVDPLEVSRFPLDNPQAITINKFEEIKLVQKFLKELKFVQSLDEQVLKNQQYYWLYTHNIVCPETRGRIKTALETHCATHMEWISDCEFEIDINPEHRIEKVPHPKKKG